MAVDLQPLGTSELIEAWERGQHRDSLRRSLVLLAAALPDAEPADLAALSLGGRDALLLLLRRWTLGRDLAATAHCPACGAEVDFEIDLDDLRVGAPAGEGRLHRLEADGVEVTFRLLDSRDLAAAGRAEDEEEARAILVSRVVHGARRRIAAPEDGADADAEAAAAFEELAVEDLPAEVVEALAGRLEELDPQAELPLRLECPSCESGWQPLFDPGPFLWQEVAVLARRLLYDVHLLAQHYGWREEDILAMSAARRDYYLEQVPT